MVLIYDIYARNIDRVVQNHYTLSKILEEQLTKWVKEHKLYRQLGKVVVVKIPDTGDSELYATLNTCYGFIQFEKHWNHHLAVKAFDSKFFKNKQIKLVVNNIPSKFAQTKEFDRKFIKKEQHFHTEKIKHIHQCYSEELKNDSNDGKISDEEYEIISHEDANTNNLYKSFYNENWDLLLEEQICIKESIDSSDEASSTISQVTVIHMRDIYEGEEEMVLSYDDLTQELENEAKKLLEADKKIEELVKALENEKEEKKQLKEEVDDLRAKMNKMRIIMNLNEAKYVEYKTKISTLESQLESHKVEKERVINDKELRDSFIKKLLKHNSRIFNKYGELLVEIQSRP